MRLSLDALFRDDIPLVLPRREDAGADGRGFASLPFGLWGCPEPLL
jgi:hypothetical protein